VSECVCVCVFVHTISEDVLPFHFPTFCAPTHPQAPTGKDFRYILNFLFQQLDPNFEFSSNFEDEVKFFMKDLGYPFSISKSSLQAVGSPHTWPSLLAMLVWLVEFFQYHEATETKDSTKQLDTENGEKVFFGYCSHAYDDFLHGVDSFTALDKDLSDTFELKNQAVTDQVCDQGNMRRHNPLPHKASNRTQYTLMFTHASYSLANTPGYEA
jgi:kinetochore protein NDC80